jgi:hypothetical protein
MEDHEDDESELGRRVVHNHYTQSRNGNGNGNGVVMKTALMVCGFLLALLVGMQGYMWRSQLDFQRDIVDRLARVETTVDALRDE